MFCFLQGVARDLVLHPTNFPKTFIPITHKSYPDKLRKNSQIDEAWGKDALIHIRQLILIYNYEAGI